MQKPVEVFNLEAFIRKPFVEKKWYNLSKYFTYNSHIRLFEFCIDWNTQHYISNVSKKFLFDWKKRQSDDRIIGFDFWLPF